MQPTHPEAAPGAPVARPSTLVRPPRPAERHLRPTTGTVAAAALAFFAFKVWNATSARLVLFVSVAAVIGVAVDLVWSLLVVRRVRVTVSADTSDLTAGDQIGLRVSVRGPRHGVLIRLGNTDSQRAFIDCPGDGVLLGVAGTRCVVTAMNVEVTSSGAAGLMRFSQRRMVSLPRPVWVGPRPATHGEPLCIVARAWGERAVRPAPAGDAVRSIRPYVPGDGRGRVHWPATAHHGQLIVKELDEPVGPRLLLVVDLYPGGHAGEAAASRGAWYACQALASGYALTLATREPARSVVAEAASPRDVSRRLASAVALLPGPEVPAGWVEGTALLVSGEGDAWL